MKTKILKIIEMLALLVLALFLGSITLSCGALIFSPTKSLAKGTSDGFEQISKEIVKVQIGGSAYCLEMENIREDVYLAIANKVNVKLEINDMSWRINFPWFPLPSSATLTKANTFSLGTMMDIRFKCFFIAFFSGVIAYLFAASCFEIARK